MSDSKGRGWLAALEAAPSSAKVLVVDDDPNIRTALTRLLERLGHRVTPVGSAEEADMQMTGGKFEVCMLDIELPRMSGIDFLSWSMHRDPFMAVIMMTGVDDTSIAQECIEKGARTYLVKPMREPFLSLAIRDALAMRRLLMIADGAASAN